MFLSIHWVKEKSCGMQSIMGVNDMDNIRSYYSFYPLSLNTGGAKLGKDLLSLNSFREVNIRSYLSQDIQYPISYPNPNT